MTVIQPTKTKLATIGAMVALGIVLCFGIIVEVFIYSQTVSSKHDIIKVSSEVEKVRLLNAELKNELYLITDAENLEKLAEKKGFIQDKNPKWVFASQF